MVIAYITWDCVFTDPVGCNEELTFPNYATAQEFCTRWSRLNNSSPSIEAYQIIKE